MGLKVKNTRNEEKVFAPKLLDFLRGLEGKTKAGEWVEVKEKDLKEKQSDSLQTVLRRNRMVQIQVGRVQWKDENGSREAWVGVFVGEMCSRVYIGVTREPDYLGYRTYYKANIPRIYVCFGDLEKEKEQIQIEQNTVPLYGMKCQGIVSHTPYYDIPRYVFSREKKVDAKGDLGKEQFLFLLRELKEEGYLFRREFLYRVAEEGDASINGFLEELDICNERLDEECALAVLEFVNSVTAERKLMYIAPNKLLLELNNDCYQAMHSLLYSNYFTLFVNEERQIMLSDTVFAPIMDTYGLCMKNNRALYSLMQKEQVFPGLSFRTISTSEKRKNYLEHMKECFVENEEYKVTFERIGEAGVYRIYSNGTCGVLFFEGKENWQCVYLDAYMDLHSAIREFVNVCEGGNANV